MNNKMREVMSKKKEPDEFTCFKCKVKFRGQASFHGESRQSYDGVTEIRLCCKCTSEARALWTGESKSIERQIREKIDYCVSQHGIDKYADAKRTTYEEILDLLSNHCIIFNGDNLRGHWGRDKTQLELTAHRIIHNEFKINCAEQIKVLDRYTVDGLIETEGKSIALEYDGYHHSTDEQKEKDRHRDSMLIEYGRYKVLRIPADIIYNNKPYFRTILLDALYDVKHSTKKREAPQLPVAPAST
jgi:very-short-patch-repair endonuclease